MAGKSESTPLSHDIRKSPYDSSLTDNSQSGELTGYKHSENVNKSQPEQDSPETSQSTPTNDDLGIPLRLLLGASLFSCEVAVTYELVYMVTMQRMMGLPVQLVSVPGLVSASVSFVVTPAMGRFGDGGVSPDKRVRKSAMVILSTSLQLGGSALLLLACVMKIHRTNESLHENDFLLQFSNLTTNCSHLLGNFSSCVIDPLKTSISEGAGSIPPEAALAMISFILMDLGFDTASTCIRAFIIDVTPSQQHERVLNTGVVLSALGGCCISVLGLLDYGSLFQSPSHASAIRGIVLCCFLAGAVFVTLPTTLITGRYLKRRFVEKIAHFPEKDHERVMKPDSKTQDNEQHRARHNSPPSSSTMDKNIGFFSKVMDRIKTWKVLAGKEYVQTVGIVCFVTFFAAMCTICFEVYFTNFIVSGVFHGKEDAAPGSLAQEHYQTGVQVASEGSLIFMTSFLVYNFLHQWIAKRIGMVTEFFLVTVVMLPLLLTVSLTKSLAVFFVLCVWNGLYRTLIFTTPFVLATEAVSQAPLPVSKAGESTDTETGTVNDAVTTSDDATANGGDNMGSVIGIVFSTIPLCYIIISAMMGPLLKATGDPATPMYFASVGDFITALALVTFACRNRRLVSRKSNSN